MEVNPMNQPNQRIDGLLLVDKPEGCTSHDLVVKARKALGLRAIGHGGTLDPMASGLLVLLAGEGTKLADYILKGDKGYRVKVRLGIETDTLDRTGKVLREQAARVTREQIEKVISELQGLLSLEVPIYSAVKVNGRKLYEAARRGEDVVEPVREMRFFDIQLLEYGEDWFTVDMKCSKGSFVRSWAREAGRRLGTGAVVDELRRLWSGPYNVSQAIKLENGPVTGGIIPLDQALPDWPSIVVDGKDRTLLENGQISYRLRARLQPYTETLRDKPGIKVLGLPERSLVALLTINPRIGEFALERVFPPSNKASSSC